MEKRMVSPESGPQEPLMTEVAISPQKVTGTHSAPLSPFWIFGSVVC
jgi:hypothetical protein